MNIAISVIVPIYNVAPYIERCVRSLMEQTFKDVEYIFVNDCTPDNSIEILQAVIEDYPERKEYVKIIHNEKNKGLAATRFVGLDQANGEYVLHCDSDDWVEKEMLEKMHEKAVQENADIVCCETIKEKSDGRYHYKYSYDEETIENGLLALQIEEIHIAIWNKLIKHSLFAKHNIRNYDGVNMGEDSALTIRLRYYSEKTIIIHKPFYHYNRMNTNSMVADIKESAILQKIELAKHIEKFFKEKGEFEKFRTLINHYKFESKQYYLRNKKDIKKWRSIYNESHKDIFKFKQLTLLGRIKWWCCAYLPIFDIFIKKDK